MVSDSCYNDLLEIDFQKEKIVKEAIFEMSSNKTLNSCNDISRGGVFISLIKMTHKDLGFDIKMDNHIDIFVSIMQVMFLL